MNKGIVFSILLLGNSFLLTAQPGKAKADSINKYVYTANKSNAIVDSLELLVDSIRVNAKLYGDKIVTTSYFPKSKTELQVEYYLKDASLVLVRITEKCPFFDDLGKFTMFYFEDCQIFHENYFWSIRGCLAIPMVNGMPDVDTFYGYNKNLTIDFLKRYTSELFNLIRGSTFLMLSV